MSTVRDFLRCGDSVVIGGKRGEVVDTLREGKDWLLAILFLDGTSDNFLESDIFRFHSYRMNVNATDCERSQ